ncbi:MAG: hypothetical protein D4R64_12615 [Porphyromonadaceae bacterium]|nr:MAG: hypothetical protein D4R64_12615 [Porphyromonadaceae bacterium]
MKKKLWRLFGIGVFLALVAAGFVYWYGFLRKEKPIERMKPDFELTADSLFSIFNANEKAATEKFGGKTLLLKSNVVSVEKDENGNVTLTLVDPMMGVTCTIDSLQVVKQKTDIDALSKGQPVTVKGRCDGMLTDVKISKCMIVK